MKDKHTLHEIWDKYVTDFVSSDEFPELTKAFHEGLIHITPHIEDIVYNNFLNCKKTVLDLYMKDPEDGIDRHKEGACLIYAMMDANPFTLDSKVVNFYKDRHDIPENNKGDDGIPYDVLLCTQICAINAAVGYVISQKVKIFDIKEKPKEFTFPSTYGQGPYLLNLAIDLYYSKKYTNYDVLAISSILFLLEKYFDLTIFNK